MKNVVLWDVAPCGLIRLLIPANVVPSSSNFVTL
jgi:hypothetical protein